MNRFIEYCFIENWRVMPLVLALLVVYSKPIMRFLAFKYRFPIIYVIPSLFEIFILINFAHYVLFDAYRQVTNQVLVNNIPQYLVSFAVYFAFYTLFGKLLSIEDELLEISSKIDR